MTIRKFILAKFPEFNLNYQYSESDLETGRNIIYEFICSIMRGNIWKGRNNLFSRFNEPRTCSYCSYYSRFIF